MRSSGSISHTGPTPQRAQRGSFPARSKRAMAGDGIPASQQGALPNHAVSGSCGKRPRRQPPAGDLAQYLLRQCEHAPMHGALLGVKRHPDS